MTVGIFPFLWLLGEYMVNLRELESQGKLIKTVNRMGHSIADLTDFSKSFIEFSGTCIAPVLDIGAAFGVASIPALEAGATVIANDMAQEHLTAIKERTPQKHQNRLQLRCAKIPYGLDFPAESLGAIHASQVLHFLTGSEIAQSFDNFYRWLVPGGKVFIIASSPYINILKAFLPEYEKKKQSGTPWPGEIENLSLHTTHAVVADNPPFFNFLDTDVLSQALIERGFKIEKSLLFDRGTNLPDHIKLDGRENVGIIAQKPVAL